MASYIFFAIFCLIGTFAIRANCNENDNWFLNINNYVLYQMIKDRHFENNDLSFNELSNSILEDLCSQHSINIAYIDQVQATRRLKNKLSSLWTSVKRKICKGGRQGLEILNKMKSDMYKLNSGGKRKIEHELESERKRRHIAEERAKERKNLVKNVKKKAREAYFLLGRLTKRRLEPKRNVKGKLSYSKSWKNSKSIKWKKLLIGLQIC